MSTTTAKLEVYSFPELCALLQKMPKQIRAAMLAMGLVPKYKVHGEDHWDREQVDTIESFFSEKEMQA